MATARRMKAPLVGLQAPAVTVLAFVPMLLTSIDYSELNKADPDCGTTFTWATRAFGPRSGWAAGWAIIVAVVLWIVAMTHVAYRGIELSASFQKALLSIELVTLLVLSTVPRCLRRSDDRQGVYRLPAVGRRRRSSGELRKAYAEPT